VFNAGLMRRSFTLFCHAVLLLSAPDLLRCESIFPHFFSCILLTTKPGVSTQVWRCLISAMV